MSGNDSNQNPKPQIIFTKYSPYMVTDLKKIEDGQGKPLETGPVISLCRCGYSAYKPYCDGSHSKAGFVGEKEEDRTKDSLKDYKGKNIIIHDNRGVCCHDGSCVILLPTVFRINEKPWIDPDGAGVAEIIDTIEKCPSGALSYTIGKRRYQDLDQEPSITVLDNGPLMVKGGVIMKDDMESKPECKEHFTLCACGKSKNKPFCDGSHS